MLSSNLEKARIRIVVSKPFFGQLLAFLKFIETDSIETLGVNCEGVILYNPKFLKNKTIDQIEAYLMHEILHLAFGHPERGFDKIPILYNIAADLKVNYCLLYDCNVSAGLLSEGILPSYHDGWSFRDVKFSTEEIEELTSEEIYERLLKYFKQFEGQNKILTAGKDIIYGKAIIGSNGEIEIRKASRAELKKFGEEIQKRIEVIKMQGLLPDSLSRDYDIHNEFKIKWSVYLSQKFSGILKKPTWRKFNKKMLPYYLPGREKEKSIKLAVGIDTSGSISRDELSDFMTELWNLSLTFPSFEMKVLVCDAEVHKVIDVNQENYNELFKIKMEGGGGTDFQPVFDYIEKKKLKIDYLIYLTDLYGNFPKQKPSYDVYWVTNTRVENPPFGKKLYI